MIEEGRELEVVYDEPVPPVKHVFEKQAYGLNTEPINFCENQAYS